MNNKNQDSSELFSLMNQVSIDKNLDGKERINFSVESNSHILI